LWTATLVGVDDETVGSVRRDLEARSEIPNVAKTTDTKGRQQPVHKPRAALTRPATAVEKISTPVRRYTATRSFRSSKANLAPQLNSLSWSDATPELRVKFINAVGVRDLWHSMNIEQKNALINLVNAEQDTRKAVRAAS